jgi:hypothetical protein
MKHSLAPAMILAGALVLLVSPAGNWAAQTSPQQPATQPNQAPQNPLPNEPGTTPPQSDGKVVFSRSIDENGEVTTSAGPGAEQPAGTPVTAPVADDAERQALTVASYDLDVHLQPADRRIAVRALLTVRNDGKTPLAHIPLQISSTLTWDRIRIDGRDMKFPVATLNSDSDHTGQLHEAALTPAEPLAPGATLQLDVSYSGTIAQSAQRMTALGAPDDVALHSNWDEIGVEFTGLRGFGDVVWYPVSSAPVILGDGARLFDEIGEHKLRNYGAPFRLRLTDEIPYGQDPTVALINGRSVPLTVTDAGEGVDGVATAALDHATLGFEAPSLFVAMRKPIEAGNVTLWILTIDEAAAKSWAAAASAVTPFLQDWLGPHPRSRLTILDLPDPEDVPSETGPAVAAPVQDEPVTQVQGMMAHALTHAYLDSLGAAPPAWLDEGVAYFMGSLWTEKSSGRTKALESLESSRPALALAEPSSPGEGPGQPLRQAIAPIYYRTKAAYVFWMLRDLAGDSALAAAFQAYDPGKDKNSTGPGEFEKLIEKNSHIDLGWFFADWVDADKGLPDLTIDGVFPARAEAGNILTAVNVSNAGYAAAEVSVTVRTADATVTQRLQVPAHGKAVRRILVLGEPTEVQVNDGTVPETQASVHVTHITPAQ